MIFSMKKGIRLSKALAQAGIASRRACEELIFNGHVKVNGTTVRVPQTLVELGIDHLLVEGNPVHGAEPKVYYLLNKPKGYICSNQQTGSKKLVVDLFRPLHQRLFTVGRLDRDTTGLLLVTNDGEFAHSVIHPSAGLVKEYLIKTSEEISHDHLVSLSKGTRVEGTFVRPKSVTKVRRGTLKIVVSEGKKREVRLLVENAGLELISLTRIRLGGLLLGNLAEGTWKDLSEKERAQIFS